MLAMIFASTHKKGGHLGVSGGGRAGVRAGANVRTAERAGERVSPAKTSTPEMCKHEQSILNTSLIFNTDAHV